MTTRIHEQVAAAGRGELPRVIARLASGWAVMGDPQILPGYALLLPDPVVPDLNALAGEARATFLADMGRLGDAVLAATGADRINYEILGNVDHALHAHVIPRYESEPAERRRVAVWLHDWTAAPAFGREAHGATADAIAAALGKTRSPGAAPADGAASDHAARIRDLDAEWLDAAARRDLDEMMAIYAPGAREFLPGMPPIVGTDAIRGFYGALLARLPRFENRFDPEEITVAASGDLAVVRGTYRFTPDAHRPAEADDGKFVGVWRRVGGEWRLALNISNSDRPPA